MNARERCRARRHARRAKDRIIMNATGANFNGGNLGKLEGSPVNLSQDSGGDAMHKVVNHAHQRDPRKKWS